MKRIQSGSRKVGVVNGDGHVIGLDIGATAVRAAVLAHRRHEGRPRLTGHGFGEVPLPDGAVVNGNVQDGAAVTDALRRLWQAERFHCRNVVVGVSNPQIVVRDMTVPAMTPELRARSLPFQARNVIALPVEQVLLDFLPLTEPNEDGTVDGLLVAAPRQPILEAVSAVERAGLRVARVDLAALATLRSIADEHSAVEAVVDIGAHLTTIVIHDRGVPRVVRTVSRGGREITDRIADDLGMSLPEAEALKREHGLVGRHTEVVRMIREAVRPLIAEIRGSHHYFASNNPTRALDRMLLTGGGALLRGLDGALGDQLGVTTRIVAPTQHVSDVEESGSRGPSDDRAAVSARPAGSSGSAVSVGLAIGAAA